MKIKITGISGYLGIGIATELRKLGHEVTGIERKLIYGSVSVLANEIENTDTIIYLS